MQAAVPPRAPAEPWIHPSLRPPVAAAGGAESALEAEQGAARANLLFGGGVSIPSSSSSAQAQAAAAEGPPLNVVGVFHQHVRLPYVR